MAKKPEIVEPGYVVVPRMVKLPSKKFDNFKSASDYSQSCLGNPSVLGCMLTYTQADQVYMVNVKQPRMKGEQFSVYADAVARGEALLEQADVLSYQIRKVG